MAIFGNDSFRNSFSFLFRKQPQISAECFSTAHFHHVASTTLGIFGAFSLWLLSGLFHFLINHKPVRFKMHLFKDVFEPKM